MYIKIEYIFIILICVIVALAFIFAKNMQAYTFIGSGQHTTAAALLLKEYKRWQLINKLQLLLWKGKHQKEKYEISNMLEWVLLERYNQTTTEEMAVKELAERFKKKNIIPNIAMPDIVSAVYATQQPQPSNTTKIPWTINKNGAVTIGNYFTRYSPERIAILLKKAPRPYDIVIMLLRYASMLIGGQQWNIPRAVYEYVHAEFGITLEGFASPINSQFLAICPATCKFCSLFPDVDEPFGSIGSIFETSLLGGRSFLNPPYVLSIMEAISKKIINTIDEAEEKKIETLIIVTVVAWLDAEYYSRLSKYKNAIDFQLNAFEYAYENSNDLDRKLTASFNSTIFVVSYPRPTVEKYKGIKEQFMRAGTKK